jgi:hypothetical protein
VIKQEQFGGPELLQQARELCQALEKLPAGPYQTSIVQLVSDAAFALQQLQETGNHFWPVTFAPTVGMTFGRALEALKSGLRVARAGWNGKGMWLSYVKPGHYDVGCGTVGFDPVTLKAPKLLPWIGMKTADDCFVPWLASQTDMHADDWCVA